MKAEDYLKKAYRSIYENDFEQAIQWFEQALTLEPDNGDIHYRCSITCARSNRLEKAMAHARLAAAIAPLQEEYKLHFDRLQSKELTNMAKRLLEGDSAESSVNKSKIAEPASRLLVRAVQLDPLSVEAQVWLAIAYAELEQYESALQAVREAAVLPQDEGVAKQLLELEQKIRKYMK
ncbi:tetratricopeptide repeat protein [Fontibacillus phaseoli]|uniref:Tetratricopeptide repeat protein n=1 Tax=Fontibacillus phaseoli TaxID=1416533 RepID=A0A369BP22_9BACL|nr:tetratricopeptide repeat protein [Fontibacillus phaseoli]RCX23293.1 tetratricopeptide repeat protein [Fontibacillus phaseoli]